MREASLEEETRCIQSHRKVFLAAEADESKLSRICGDDLGFDIIRCITQKFLIDEKTRAFRFSTRFARGKDEESSNPYSGEIRSVSESESTRATC